MIKAIIFDFYGTLVDETEGYKTYSKLIFKKYTNELYEEFVHEWFLKQREIIFNHGYKPFSDIIYESLQKIPVDFKFDIKSNASKNNLIKIFENMRPFRDSIICLKNLKKIFLIGILTNSDNNFLKPVVKKLNFKFDLILTGEDLKSYKPNKINYQSIINSLKLRANEILYASASVWDINAAKDFGFKTVFVNRKNEKINNLSIKADFIINNLRELIDLTKKLNFDYQPTIII